MPSPPLILGHRGASRAAPENTLAAFALARELGADGVELDVRRSADGELIVHHDPHIEGLGLLVDEPFATLRAHRPDVPTLGEALVACAGMLVNVEIKCLPWDPDPEPIDRPVVHGVVDLVRRCGADVIISSFDLGAVDACRAYASELPTGWLTSGQELGAAAQMTADHGHTWLNPDRRAALAASPDVVARIHDRGIRLSAWTVDEPHEVRALADAAFDAIITNVPDVARAALA